MERLDFDKINDGDIVLVEVVLSRQFVPTVEVGAYANGHWGPCPRIDVGRST